MIQMLQATRIWDLPTRVFHWVLAVCVLALILTGNLGGSAMDWHYRFGYAVLGLLLFRMVWGLVGGYWSRFRTFLYRPRTVIAYLRGHGSPSMHAGHSPLGALSVYGMLAVLLLQVATGLISDDAISFTGPLARFVPGSWTDWASQYHKSWGANLVLGLSALHILAVLLYLFIGKTNLILPMVFGDKSCEPHLPASRDDTPSRSLALALFALCAAIAAWVAWLG